MVTASVFLSHEDAERAVIELQRAGFDMTRLSTLSTIDPHRATTSLGPPSFLARNIGRD
jgi:hypothetical protein